MKNIKRITLVIVTMFLALISAGCMVPPPGSGSTPIGHLNLCVYADDIIDLNLVINASDANGNPFGDDDTGALYVDYITVGRTAERDVPNECGSQRPYHVVRLKADVGSTIHASIRVTGPTKRDLLTCVYFVNGVEIPASRMDGRNSIVCRYVGKV
jgi:hypothetical protein